MHERKKIAETEYFLTQMQEQVNDRDAFCFNVSAFLSASRSVLQYALEGVKNKPGGQSWYDAHMQGNAILKFFKDKRDVNIHVEPVEPERSADITASEKITITESVVVVIQDQQGNVVGKGTTEPVTAPARQASQPASIRCRYWFSEWNGPEDVQELAQLYLNELKAFVADGYRNL